MKCPICGSDKIDFVAERNTTLRAEVVEIEEVDGKTKIKVGEYKTENDNKNYFECKNCGKKMVITDVAIEQAKPLETLSEEVEEEKV